MVRTRKVVEKKFLKILGPYNSILRRSWIDALEGAPKIHLRLSRPMDQRHEHLLFHPDQFPHRLLHLGVLSPVAHIIFRSEVCYGSPFPRQ
jgi:hypothetical protein